FTLPAPTEPDTPSLHVALPISNGIQWRRAVWVFAGWRESVVGVMRDAAVVVRRGGIAVVRRSHPAAGIASGSGRSYNRLQRVARSEEHTSELQSRENLVCRLLL